MERESILESNKHDDTQIEIKTSSPVSNLQLQSILQKYGCDQHWLKTKTTERLESLMEEYRRNLDIETSLLQNDILNNENASELIKLLIDNENAEDVE